MSNEQQSPKTQNGLTMLNVHVIFYSLKFLLHRKTHSRNLEKTTITHRCGDETKRDKRLLRQLLTTKIVLMENATHHCHR